MHGHRVAEDWMGERVTTLEDLLRPRLRAVCVGINPSLVSVEAGHYYQGRLGRRFLARLERVGLLPPGPRGREDDTAFASGVGFTDLVKRPTARAAGLRPDEYAHGSLLLRAKLERFEPAFVIFTYKRTAQVLLGDFPGCGFRAADGLPATTAFVMPGPYERPEAVERILSDLADWLRAQEGRGAVGPRP